MMNAFTQKDPCPICRILAAAQGQVGPVALQLLLAATRVPCACPTQHHTPLAAHPHRQAGCGGYGAGVRRVA
jgi:hypothetical protein